MNANPYEILGVRKNASQKSIRSAFVKLSKKHHPDAGGDVEEFRKIAWAYEVLKDPEKRAIYDATGEYDEAAIQREQNMLGNIICNAFSQAITESGGQIDTVDLIAYTKRSMQNDIAAGRNKIRSLNGEIEKAEKIMKRLSFRGNGTDFIKTSFEATVNAKRSEIARHETAIENMGKAIEYMRDYGYQTDGGMWDFGTGGLHTGGIIPRYLP